MPVPVGETGVLMSWLLKNGEAMSSATDAL